MIDERALTLLDQIEEAVRLASTYVEGLGKAEFLKDSRTQQAVAMNLVIIGEAVSRLETGFPEFMARFPEIPWRSMRGMRNRIAHGYFELDMEIVFDTVQTELPRLSQSLPALRAAVNASN